MHRLTPLLTHMTIDLEGARARFLYDDALYMACLEEFIASSEVFLLRQSLDQQEYAQAEFCAHNLKGVCGNLGLTALYEKSDIIVKSLRIQELSTAISYADAFCQDIEKLKIYLSPR